MFAMAEMTYQIMFHHLEWRDVLDLLMCPFQFRIIPCSIICCATRVNCVVRANRARISSIVLTYISPTNSTSPPHDHDDM